MTLTTGDWVRPTKPLCIKSNLVPRLPPRKETRSAVISPALWITAFTPPDEVRVSATTTFGPGFVPELLTTEPCNSDTASGARSETTPVCEVISLTPATMRACCPSPQSFTSSVRSSFAHTSAATCSACDEFTSSV